ncbi:MAG: UDP-N-acetylmuramoyl-L-alanyl-D-glutamate--2,6-diaminopimelate ligase [Ancrocorticia sp.]|uniref:UDP-N-acetylmuramoyl-L-alanyl-D-glutamate--2, 6-diaminopimelate ligase n=1 Tax=Ancrocorticia sp. TaxID=2593684 RepID=UPI003F90EE49
MTELSRLAEIIDGRCTGDAAVSSVTSDSRAVPTGALFGAVPGLHVHGARFAASAVADGAIAVATDPEGERIITSMMDDVPPLLVVDNIAARLGEIAAEVYGNPSAGLTSFAVTGTNGKTTTAFMLDNVLGKAGRTTGLIGTVSVRLAGTEVPAALTTPMPADLQRVLADLVRRGGTDLVMETSSHALAQGRTDPVRFSVAGFTNLTQDHLDFHRTLEEYFEAKASLFTPERCEKAVIIVDDEWGLRLWERSISLLGAENVYALAVATQLPEGARGWQVTEVNEGADSTAIELANQSGEHISFTTALPGQFNVANAALAVTMANVGGLELRDLPETVDPQVPGRMETISSRPRVVVDFAHNTDALAKAITALRPTTKGKLIVVTGAAGERDKGKRPAMGQTVGQLADVAIITDDDPHDEDPAVIRNGVLAGAEGLTAHVEEIANRSLAIEASILDAGPDDTILLAGRGHETIQEVAGERIELDDRVEARKALAQWASKPKEKIV